MIRLTFVLRRKTDMSRAEFQQYWRGVHGPLVAGYAAALNMHRYVQVHTLDDPVNDQLADARGGMEPPYDGVAEVWWRNRDALVSALDTAAGRDAAKALVEDEARFIDLVHSPLWLNYEYPQVNPIPEEMIAREHGPFVKIFFCLRHPERLSLDEAQLYWRTNHGPVIRGVATGMRMQRYFQVHRFEDELEAQLRTSRGTETPPYTGHAEAWFTRADLATLADSPEAQRAMEIAVEDESHFIDFERSAMWIAKEHEFVDRR